MIAIVARHAWRFVRDEVRYVVRVGAWWVPVAIVVLGLAVVLAATSQVVVPHAVYVLF